MHLEYNSVQPNTLVARRFPYLLRTFAASARRTGMGTLDLNDALLRALKCAPDQRLLEIRDASIPGLEIRIWASGIKSWRLHYTRRSDGRRRVAKLGRYP